MSEGGAGTDAALRAEVAALRAERDRLTYELGHRVKNTLGVVQALASQTLRGATTPAEAMDALTRRILALSRANDAILREGWTTADLGTVARRVLEPDLAAGAALSIEGPDLRLRAGAALSFAMALQELASNARRHGAWRQPDGRVDLRWTTIDGRLDLAWIETGGPPAEAPARRSFGLRLIETSLQSAFGGDVGLTFAPEGVRCHVSAAVSDPSAGD